MVLHLVQTQGQGKTLKECKVSAEQVVKTPMSIDELEHQMEFYKEVYRSSSQAAAFYTKLLT
eukprot:11108316-Ditylum_brightwellii.AAC.1